MSCCQAEEDKTESKPKLARNEQIERDMIRRREEETARQREREEESRRRLAEVERAEREKQEIYREKTAFVEKLEKEKQQMIIKFNQEVSKEKSFIQNLQDKQELFKRTLEKDVIKNSKAFKCFISQVEEVTQISQLENVWAKRPTAQFQSIREFFGEHSFKSSIHENSQIVLQKLIQIYNFFAESKIYEKKLLICVSCYIKFLEEVVERGYNQSVGDVQLKGIRELMKTIDKTLYQQFENILEIAKSKFTKERSRILEEVVIDTSSQEIQLRSKIDELQKRMQVLLNQNQHYKSENQMLNSITLPNLKDQLHKKDIRIEQNTEILSQMQKTLMSKIEIETHFQKLEQLICGFAAKEQTKEVLKSKDLAIEKLQAQITKFQKEKSLLSEQTEPDRRQLAYDLLLKEKEIEQLSEKLEEREQRIKALEEKPKQVPIIRSSNNKAESQEMLLLNESLNKENREKEAQISTLKARIEELEKISKRDTQDREEMRQSLASVEKQLCIQVQRHQLHESEASKQQSIISTLQEEVQNNKAKMKEDKARINELESSSLALYDEISHLNRENSELKLKLQQSAERQSILSQSRRMQINRQSEERIREFDEIEKLNLEKQALLKENEELKANSISLASEVDDLMKKITQMTTDLESQFEFKLSQAEMRANNAEVECYQLKSIIQTSERTKRDLENQIDKLRNEADRYKTDAEKNKIEAEKYKSQNAILKKELDKLREELDNLKQEHNRTISDLSEQKVLSMNLQNRIQKIKLNNSADNGKRMRTASFVEHRTLFIGDVLQKRKKEKKFLMDAIEGLMQRQIEKTKLLYEFRRDQKTNFHSFIDGHQNIVLVLETKKALLACYYSGIIQENTPMTEEALILSLDSGKTYFLNTLQHNPAKDPKDTKLMRGMIYDKYFLIFGNAEVRVRTGEKLVFSNFGKVNSSYFDARRENVDSLLHEGLTNEVEFLNYEIHEVFFNEEFTLQRTF